MDFDRYETLPTNNCVIHMSAGAIAGIAEHCFMYPLDSIKTKMQSLSPHANYAGFLDAVRVITRREGKAGLLRGMGVVVAGAGPAHALYFSSYEYFKETLKTKTTMPFFMAAGGSSVIATVLHDGLMTPAEVVKQRMQMFKSPYKNVHDCFTRTYKAEGLRAFYRSYSTQLLMNIPFQAIHFMTYEFCQELMNKDKTYNPLVHVLSGAAAGAVAAGITTPLDVMKTLLNTQQLRVRGMLAAFNTVRRISGYSGYFRGVTARILYQMPSTGICWFIYESFKFLLLRQVMEGGCADKPLTHKSLISNDDIPSKFRPGMLLEFDGNKDGIMELSKESKNISEKKNNSWENVEDSTRNESKARSLIEGLGRTYADKSRWGNAMFTGTQVLGTLTMNTTLHAEECIPRVDLLDDVRS